VLYNSLMPESAVEEPMEKRREAETKTELLFRSGILEILGRAHLDIKVQEEDGAVSAIVDDEDRPRQGNLDADGVLIDEINMDALKEFFSSANVNFEGDPWTTEDQEDFLGSISINTVNLNDALRTGRLVLKREERGETYTFDGLDESVEAFLSSHEGDEKYFPD